jgi:hypothetical protein
MKVLHLLTDGPTDVSTKIIEGQSAGNDIKVIDMSKKEASYEDIIDEIFSRDRVISW